MDDEDPRDLADDVVVLLTENKVDCQRILEKLSSRSTPLEPGREDGEIDDKDESGGSQNRKVTLSETTEDDSPPQPVVTSIESDEDEAAPTTKPVKSDLESVPIVKRLTLFEIPQGRRSVPPKSAQVSADPIPSTEGTPAVDNSLVNDSPASCVLEKCIAGSPPRVLSLGNFKPFAGEKLVVSEASSSASDDACPESGGPSESAAPVISTRVCVVETARPRKRFVVNSGEPVFISESSGGERAVHKSETSSPYDAEEASSPRCDCKRRGRWGPPPELDPPPPWASSGWPAPPPSHFPWLDPYYVSAAGNWPGPPPYGSSMWPPYSVCRCQSYDDAFFDAHREQHKGESGGCGETARMKGAKRRRCVEERPPVWPWPPHPAHSWGPPPHAWRPAFHGGWCGAYPRYGHM
eukprot:Gregarina_sp_Pseudo_9__2207@NODE_254_length_3408_cov_12_512912_g237_i0_p2_GENE_NODE_254_length_3408_cov_12_512912_g237_i0NODE_254_length_3408_cov_12_512912_g237_i0_p2_ORF_typecomplete_len408_score75_61_NODE_254_length_3408_cov_12_512912_g237_i021463369